MSVSRTSVGLVAAVSAAIGVGASLGLGPHDRPWKGSQWEYATMTRNEAPAPTGQAEVPEIRINGLVISGLPDISAMLALERNARDDSEVLEGMGARGWELVAFDRSPASATDPAIHRSWIFKRPKMAK